MTAAVGSTRHHNYPSLVLDHQSLVTRSHAKKYTAVFFSSYPFPAVLLHPKQLQVGGELIVVIWRVGKTYTRVSIYLASLVAFLISLLYARVLQLCLLPSFCHMSQITILYFSCNLQRESVRVNCHCVVRTAYAKGRNIQSRLSFNPRD